MFWTTKHSMNQKYHVFSGYKERGKVGPVYFEGKPQQKKYGWRIFRLKCKKKVEKTYLQTSKQQTRYHYCFKMLKSLPKANYCIIPPFQQRREVECMYLAF